jgi:hypothetical protein
MKNYLHKILHPMWSFAQILASQNFKWKYESKKILDFSEK